MFHLYILLFQFCFKTIRIKTMDTVLLVEHDQDIRKKLREKLERHNFLIIEAVHKKRLFEILKCHDVDLVILNTCLPEGNSINFLSDMRTLTNAPIILINGKCDKNIALQGLNGGADGCINGQLDIDIFIAIIKANIRRYKKIGGIEDNEKTHENDKEKTKFGRWLMDPSQYQVFNDNGESAELTVREFRLLETLIKNVGRAVHREELCEAIREGNYTPAPRALDVKITRIRKKIETNAHNPQLIVTVRGIGYMMKSI